MGVYDIPAVINYILKKTNEQQLSYVGHSMGTTALWIALSEHPELNSKIKVMIALAPVAFLSNARSPVFRTMAPLLKVVPTSVIIRLNVSNIASYLMLIYRIHTFAVVCEFLKF